MTRKPGRPPLPRNGTTIRRLPVHATDDEYNGLMAALHVDTRERFFQIDGAVTDYNIHVDEIAAERDELLDAIRRLVNYRDSVGALSFQLEKADDYINRMRSILAQCEDNAVTSVTTQEDSDDD